MEELSIGGGKKPFSFKEQFAKGRAAEASFFKKHPGLIRLDGKKGEYIIRLTMDKVELKTDFYRMAQTPNCFIEVEMEYNGQRRISGVHQAIANNCKYFVYWFIEDDYEMWFEPMSLADMATDWWYTRSETRREIVNRSDDPPHYKYSAHGVLIPRTELAAIVVNPPI